MHSTIIIPANTLCLDAEENTRLIASGKNSRYVVDKKEEEGKQY